MKETKEDCLFDAGLMRFVSVGTGLVIGYLSYHGLNRTFSFLQENWSTLASHPEMYPMYKTLAGWTLESAYLGDEAVTALIKQEKPFHLGLTLVEKVTGWKIPKTSDFMKKAKELS